MPLKDYLSPNADKLVDKVDFTKMIGDFGRAGVAALFAAVTGYILSIKKSINNIADTAINSMERVVLAFVGSFDLTTETARQTAQAELVEFGYFALPVSLAVSLSAIIGAVVVFTIFWGDS